VLSVTQLHQSTGAFICYYRERHAEQEVLSRGRHSPELLAYVYRCELAVLLKGRLHKRVSDVN